MGYAPLSNLDNLSGGFCVPEINNYMRVILILQLILLTKFRGGGT